jgi:hypothetical protein
VQKLVSSSTRHTCRLYLLFVFAEQTRTITPPPHARFGLQAMFGHCCVPLLGHYESTWASILVVAEVEVQSVRDMYNLPQPAVVLAAAARSCTLSQTFKLACRSPGSCLLYLL